uniref:Electron transfer flavoprotein subunit beta n=1 Tax=Spongospora subterranea TaxID=70186 RepID=A0A0H5R9M1_9EUKA|eukprot:CRZ10382.1 hypothetical protein [Spongospora subterranea]
MKILVPIKRVVDFAVKVRVSADKSGIDLANVKMAMNPFCEIAVEEAVRLKEQKHASEVVAVSIGGKQCQETLRTALAMGVDRAVHIQTDLRTDQELQPLAVSKLIAKLVLKEKSDMVILGKQSIDDDSNQTGQMLAGLMKWPQATFASKITVEGDKRIQVTREVDGGLQTVSCTLPAVVTCDLRLNQPRYSSLPNIMKARKKPLETMNAAEMDVPLDPRLKVKAVVPPAERKAGVIVDSVDTLIETLKSKGVIP